MNMDINQLRNLKPWHYGLLGALFLGLILLALKGDAYAKFDPFPAAQFSESSADFLGNQYVLRAQIDSQLQWDPQVGVYSQFYRITVRIDYRFLFRPSCQRMC